MGSSTISSPPSFMEENDNNGLLSMEISTVFIASLCGRNQHQTGRPFGKLPHVLFTSLDRGKHQLGLAHEKFPRTFLTDMYVGNQRQRNHDHENVHSAFIADDYGRSQYERFRIYALFNGASMNDNYGKI
jgi:hypothetical protein